MSRRKPSWNAKRARALPVSSMGLPPPKVSSAMPALKCLPVDEITSTRACPPSCSACTASRKAGKNAGAIVFMRSGRLSCRWAMPSATSRRK